MNDQEFKKTMAQIRADHKAKAEANRRASMSEYERNREDRIRKVTQQMEDEKAMNTLKLKIKKFVKEEESQAQSKPEPKPRNVLDAIRGLRESQYQKSIPSKVLQKLPSGRIVGLPSEVKNQLDSLLTVEGDMFDISQQLDRVISSLGKVNSKASNSLMIKLQSCKKEAFAHESSAAANRQKILSRY
ncbi:hypothetical protein WJR50_33000 [Catalinimonas sp. 4WD22]|uniref:hypothetical protein n=1 Tax=Catalinimonas locisalis TaxID=3133978 RepID=UPI003100DC5F